MPLPTEDKATRLQLALAEMRVNRHLFSEDSFGQIAMLLLRELQATRTDSKETPLLVSAKPADELRLVTVMFVDVIDSTIFMQNLVQKFKLDASSEWKTIIGDVHQRIANLVNNWQGQVGQYLGDGVLCFFGAQHSQGNEAVHAVSCAVAIIEEFKDFAQQIKEKYAMDFGLRIGISTGRLVVGMIGNTSKQELLALGPATNRAARLQSIADPSSIYIDSATHARVRREFIMQAKPPTQLKGFEKPVAYYEVLSKRPQATSQFTETQVNGIEMPFVGRDEDIALISYLIDKAVNDECFQAVTLMGDIGIGKSRLLQETLNIMAESFHYLVMNASYELSRRPYNLLYDLLQNQCDLNSEMSEELLLSKVTTFITAFSAEAQPAETARAFASLAGHKGFTMPAHEALPLILNWFDSLTQNHHVFIVVDNLQWADRQSIALLEQIVQRVTNRTGLLLTAARPDYRAIHPQYMRQYPYHTLMTLDRLRSEFTMFLIQTVLWQVQRIPDYMDVAGILNQRSEGNPLFVNEFLGTLFDEGVFAPLDGGGWKFNLRRANLVTEALPDALIGILQARLDDLPAPARYVAQLASISGLNFWADMVQSIAHDIHAQDLIDMLVMRGMVIQNPQSGFEHTKEYVFRHSLYREVAYEMLPRSQRIEYHLQMTNWLLSHIAGKHEFYALLAEQFKYSEQFGAALYTYLEAVENSLRYEKFAEALSVIDRSLGIANRVPRDEALPIASKLWTYRAQTLVILGRYDEASAAAQSALMLLKELPKGYLQHIQILAERMLGLAHASLGHYNEAYDALTRAYNLLHHSATVQLSSVLRSFGTLFLYQGRLEDSLAYQRRAYNHAQTAGDQRITIETLSQIGVLDFERGRVEEAMECFEQTLPVNRQKGFATAAAQDLYYLGTIYLALLQYEQAYDYFTKALDLRGEVSHYNVLIEASRAVALIYMGRSNEGRIILQDVFQRGHKDIYIQRQLQLTYMMGLAGLYDFVQCREQALAFVQQLKDENQVQRARGLAWLGYATYHLGNLESVSILQEALELEQFYGGREVWFCHYLLALTNETSLEVGNHWANYHYRQAARLLYERYESLDGRTSLQEDFLKQSLVQTILIKAKELNPHLDLGN